MTTRTALSRHPASTPAGRNVIGIASGKGGVGKTWLAITLAHALARLGKRVLLFDGDLGLANIDIQLGVSPSYDVAQLVAGRADVASCVTHYPDGGFDLIAGRSGSGSLASISDQKLTDLRAAIYALAERYDAALIDLGAGIDLPVRLLNGGAGRCLVVTTAEPTALTDAYAFIKVTRSRSPATALSIAVNAAETRKEGERTYETLRRACENFLKVSPALAGIVRRDGRVPESIRNQRSLMTRHPNSDAAHDVECMAQTMLPHP